MIRPSPDDELITVEIGSKIITANLSQNGEVILEGEQYIARKGVHTYVSEHEADWHLLTCKNNKRRIGQHYIIPEELGYYYNWSECHPVVSIEDNIDLLEGNEQALKIKTKQTSYNAERLREDIVVGVLANPLLNENYSLWEDKENNLTGLVLKISGRRFEVVIADTTN